MTLPTATARIDRADLVPLLPAAATVVLWIVWIADSGGYGAEVWSPSALGVMSLWGLVLILARRVLPARGPARIGLLLFAGLVALNYLSILWAAAPGNALTASNELALYLLLAWIWAVLPWTPRALAIAVGAWSAGVFVVCALALLHATSAHTLTAFYVNDRFATPMQYSNATGALAVMGMWPALILASRRELASWLRVPLTGIAVFLAGFATLPQSRAALLGMILTAPLALLATSGRLRLLARMAIVGGALAVVLPATVHLDSIVSIRGNATPVFNHAAATMLWTSVAGLVVGLVLGLAEWRVDAAVASRGPRQRARRLPVDPRRLRRAGTVVVALGCVVVGVVAAPRISSLVHSVIAKGSTDASTGTDRLLSASPEERFDYARVALRLFEHDPIVGVGSGNFGRRYDALRHFVKHSQYTHDLPLRVLSETGIVGEALFIALIVVLLVGLFRSARRHGDLRRAHVAIALCVAAYFLIHSCLDWVDEFPALAAPAIALPLAALALDPRRAPGLDAAEADRRGESASGRSKQPWRSRPAAVRAGLLGGVMAAVAVWVALASSYLSMRYVDRAFATFRATPSRAYADLSTAQALSPLDADPVTSEGTIALYLGNAHRSEAAFQRSLGLQDDWYPRLELALGEDRSGNLGAAAVNISAAVALDADDPVIDGVRRAILAHRRLNPFAINQQVLQEGSVTSTAQAPVR